MQKPSARQRKMMERATTTYQDSLSSVTTYLHGRGIDLDTAVTARLGAVASPEPGHEQLLGRLAIPYLDMAGVYAIKFRCTIGHDCKAEGCSKYLGLPGQEIGLYNIRATDSTRDIIHVAEGELDTLVLTQVFPNDPCVGVPGVNLWKPWHPFHFAGFDQVLLWMDGDKAGQDLGNKLRHELRQAEVVSIPKGMDVSDLYVAVGAEVMRTMVGMDEDGE